MARFWAASPLIPSSLANPPEILSLQVSADNDLAVRRAKVVDRLVKHGKQALERLIFAVAGSLHVVVGVGLFPHFDPGFPTLQFRDLESRARVEPSGEAAGPRRELSRLRQQADQHILGGFLGQLPVARPPEADRENHVHMPAGECLKRRIISIPAVSQEEVGVAAIIGLRHARALLRSRMYTRRVRKSDRKFSNFPADLPERYETPSCNPVSCLSGCKHEGTCRERWLQEIAEGS